MRVSKAVDQFRLSCEADGLSPKTIRWYLSILNEMLSAFVSVEVDDVTTKDLRLYIVGLRTRTERYTSEKQKPKESGGLSEATIASHIRALHRFWSWASDEYQIENPMKRIKRPPKVQSRPKAIKEADFRKLFDATLNSRDRAILAFFADTGCRLGGLLSLTLDSVDITNGWAIVEEKGKQRRKVYFTHYTGLLLYSWLDDRDAVCNSVFTSFTTGEALKPSGIHELLKRLKKRAKVTGRVNPHAFRHAFATQYILDGGDIVTLAKQLGHSQIQTTLDYYALFSEDELRDLQKKHSPLLRMLKRSTTTDS